MARKLNGEAVKALRDEQGIRQAELARRVGIDRSALNHMEAGRSGAFPETARRIATELGVTLDDVLAAADRASADMPPLSQHQADLAASLLADRRLPATGAA